MHFTREQRDAWYANTKDSSFNRWLRGRTMDGLGKLDLDALRAVAAEYGIDARAYAHLKPGQQRMNIGNRLRKLVPPPVHNDDARSSTVRSAPVQLAGAALDTPSITLPVTPLRLADATSAELLGFYADVLEELRTRGVVRTGNAPLGDYAEHLFAKAFG